MRRILFVVVVAAQWAVDAGAQGFGTSRLIRDWTFCLGGEAAPEATAWRPVTVPHDWSVELPASPEKASCTGYLPGGIGWYRTELDIPASQAGKRFYLYFEGVYNRSEVFVNGTSVGRRPNGYVSFLYDITHHVKLGGMNVVTVRVDHRLDADSRWYTGSGIYRPVHLVTANPVHLGLWGVYYEAAVNTGGAAELRVEATVENHASAASEVEVAHRLLDPDGSVVAATQDRLDVGAGGSATATRGLFIHKPRLWGVDSPNLYTLETTLKRRGRIVDSTRTGVGIRTLAFDSDRGFALNGEGLKVKGVCLHHDAGVLGAAVPKEVWRARLMRLKELGCNGIRMSHNPQATALYDLCDELGFLVMDEAFDEWEYPKKKWITGWNKGTPGFHGAAYFFEQWAERDLAAMVRRDRNHPSVILWSIGNEVDYPNDPYSHPTLDRAVIGQQHVRGYKKEQPHADRLGEIAHRLAAVVRGLDRSRPVTAALAGPVMSNETDYPAALDVVGYNYTEDRYQLDHERYPDRVLYGSETRHDLAAWKAVADNEFIFGQFIWTGFDYLGESGAWPSRGFSTGMIDLANNIKPRGYFRRALWAEKPVAYLGVQRSVQRVSLDAGRRWDYEDGRMVRVVCYTNGEEAELFLEGVSVGARKMQDPTTAIIFWDIPYKAGALKVVAYRGGEAVATDTLRPDGKAHAVAAEPVLATLAGNHAVSVIPVSIVDAAGRLVYGADHEVTCEVRGPGRLLGLENASSNAAENHRDNKARCKHGRLLAYVQATADAGEIEVVFSAAGLEPAKPRLRVGARP